MASCEQSEGSRRRGEAGKERSERVMREPTGRGPDVAFRRKSRFFAKKAKKNACPCSTFARTAGARDAKSGRRSREGGRAHLFGGLAFDGGGLDDRLGGVLGGGSLDGLRSRWGGEARGARGHASAIVRISIDYARRERASKLALTTPRRRNRASASSVRARGATRRCYCARAVISSGEGQAETRGARDARRARARAASRRRIHNRRSSRSVVHIEGDGVGRRARFGFRAGGYLPPRCSSLLPRQTS